MISISRRLCQFIQKVAKPGCKHMLLWVGIGASAIPEQILSHIPAVDSVICGEGDFSIVDLAKTVIREEAAVQAGIYLRQGGKVLWWRTTTSH